MGSLNGDQGSSLPGLSSLRFVEGLYEDFLRDPASVPEDWRSFFSESGDGQKPQPPRFGPSFRSFSVFNPPGVSERRDDCSEQVKQDRVYMLIRLYRVRGHRIAQVDPLGIQPPMPPELKPEFLGFSEADMNLPVHSETFQHGEGSLTLGQLLEQLRNTYCRSIGVQYMHIDELNVRRWLQGRMEPTENRLLLSREAQLRILTRLTDAVTFEEFIRKKFIGAKSFSLEGSESLIPLLDLAIEKAIGQGIQEIVLGMAHRGRLNVLANIMGKSPRLIFREFADIDWRSSPAHGDVKYHLGYSTDWVNSDGKKIHLSLCFNPSHLEFVNAVALGRTRAKQDRAGDRERRRGMTLLIHGDASFPGQGVVQETLNLSQLSGYTTGGTLHVILNNQIGFTTGPEQARSSPNASDIARMLQIPIFHVNGEDPEAVAQVVRLAMDFRWEFKRDVVIVMYGYRRLGHNEGDEPSFTQPVLYRAIAGRKSVRAGYLEHLLKLGEVTREEAEAIAERRREALEKELEEVQSRTEVHSPKSKVQSPGGKQPRDSSEQLRGIWAKYRGGLEREERRGSGGEGGGGTSENVAAGALSQGRGSVYLDPRPSTLSVPQLANWLELTTWLPADFHPHPKIQKLAQMIQKMAHGEEPLNWTAAEILALASLACEGFRIRLSGQDSERGTFSQRHAVLHEHEDGHTWIPLQHLAPNQAPVEILNSPLSETGVLGFEYGYSLDYPDALVLWEAQYGDFFNVAQPIMDQFIASAEEKWQRLSGLVLLLPHGFEGQGPEHSSARLERFLELAAGDNIQVVYPTTPAQYFHCLRRQMLVSWRKPLVVLTPKSLLRHPRVVSSLQDCAEGIFQRVLPDHAERFGVRSRFSGSAFASPEPGKALPMDRERTPNASPSVRRILLCAGKIYYELAAHREETRREDLAIIRLEQLYPLPHEMLEAILASYPEGTPTFWVQEEPENMGAWRFLRVHFGERLFDRFPFSCISRPAAGSPAVGSHSRHKQEQTELIARAFGGS
ncbi:MAG: multifunctional oxoglutarate decarboxylase/oxoglutarate dehydrogenase thiamine pyrophosphate-binding subunit/dihydrolipoyllysine-residue succinyltransferase subunit [Verrucomicrobia bacterium]|nr:MAG: multifunctional oxoglutarate decarboxylase/oxoglutarate dehydrogenase thiamine pyrophosphate-binding subunit/dihydrolipoyllysine-residue succinyltransferase subunit [Verrucomicrobiota bacterium]